ncbi:MAG: hypothetical protein JWR63_165, partial [Conexibacter sp.]|nr:hypothetical protein [Conexibacter sp.]
MFPSMGRMRGGLMTMGAVGVAALGAGGCGSD